MCDRLVLVSLLSLGLGCASLLTLGCDAFGYQEQAGTSSKEVFVLAHGLGATSELGFSAAIGDALVEEGYAVYKTDVPPFDSVQVRATALAKQVDGILVNTGADKIHLIGHSMGGLDSRYMISTLGYGDRVASLTTIATPHRGSAVADWVLEEDDDGGTRLETLATLLGDDEATQAATKAAVIDLSEANAATFNAANLDDPGVRYVSWAGFATVLGSENPSGTSDCEAGESPPPEPDSLAIPFLAIASIVGKGDEDVAHDGLVPVSSSKWGSFRGCVAADHFDEVGIGIGGDFDAPALYKRIAADVTN